MGVETFVVVVVTALITGSLQTIITVAAVKTDVQWLKKSHDHLWAELSTIRNKNN